MPDQENSQNATAVCGRAGLGCANNICLEGWYASWRVRTQMGRCPERVACPYPFPIVWNHSLPLITVPARQVTYPYPTHMRVKPGSQVLK